MRRIVLFLLGPACALVLLLVCFHAVLFGGEQFAYRDAGPFLLPPLPPHPAGMGRRPLAPLGPLAECRHAPARHAHERRASIRERSSTRSCAYPWATRLYTIAHVVIAWAGMFALARAWRQSRSPRPASPRWPMPSAPVLFQYCNVIYLVGAAWVPWGFLALEYAAPPEAALGACSDWPSCWPCRCSAAIPRRRTSRSSVAVAMRWCSPRRERPGRRRVLRVLSKPWVVLASGPRLGRGGRAGGLCRCRRSQRPGGCPARSGSCWLIAGGGSARGSWWRWWRQARAARLGPMLAALAGGCALAVACWRPCSSCRPWNSAAGATARPTMVTMDIYYFSVEPWRLAELVWPSVFGITGAENRSYFQALPRVGNHALWTPSLYLGGLTLVLALGAAGMGTARARRGGPGCWPWWGWASWQASAGSSARSGGSAGSAACRGCSVRPTPRASSSAATGSSSMDRGVLTGCWRWSCPGFGLFRYPGKLMTFVALAVAGLAGLGWDRVADGRTRRPARWCAWGLAATALAGLVTTAARPWITAARWRTGSSPTPRMARSTCRPRCEGTRRALIHGGSRSRAGAGPDAPGAAAAPAGRCAGPGRHGARPRGGQRPAHLDRAAGRVRGDAPGCAVDRRRRARAIRPRVRSGSTGWPSGSPKASPSTGRPSGSPS